jgi:hypothetical protein
MGLEKKLENSKNSIVLLYAKKFRWKNDNYSDLTNGQPTQGRVYRALKDGINDVYYVSIESDAQEVRPRVDGLRISHLLNVTPEWECDFIQLTDDNIVEFDILPEDYKKINDWVSSDHQDFLDRLQKPKGQEIVASYSEDSDTKDNPNIIDEEVKDLSKKIMEAVNDRLNTHINEAHSWINKLSGIDPMFIETLADITEFIVKVADSAARSKVLIPLSKEIALSEDYGKGANLYGAFFNLEDYTSTSDPDALRMAIYHCLLEMVRRKMNRLDEKA